MFHWDDVDTSPVLGGQMSSEMAIRHNRRTTRTELKSFCRWIYFHLRLRIFFRLSYGGRSLSSPHGSTTGVTYRSLIQQTSASHALLLRPVSYVSVTVTVIIASLYKVYFLDRIACPAYAAYFYTRTFRGLCVLGTMQKRLRRK